MWRKTAKLINLIIPPAITESLNVHTSSFLKESSTSDQGREEQSLAQTLFWEFLYVFLISKFSKFPYSFFFTVEYLMVAVFHVLTTSGRCTYVSSTTLHASIHIKGTRLGICITTCKFVR